ncbi:MAG TPA: hypothetical protein VLH13_05115 [Methanomassiliicoccales archaeon]|nr:hypothetical protein [Methanomassiliicoccales archaeon]
MRDMACRSYALTFLAIGLLLISLSGNASGTMTENVSSTDIAPGQVAYFTIKAYDTTECDIQIIVTAGPNVDIFLFDEENFSLFKKGESAHYIIEATEYNTTSVTADVTLGPGKYYLVIDNTELQGVDPKDYDVQVAAISAAIGITDGTVAGPTVTSEFYQMFDWILIVAVAFLLFAVVIIALIALRVWRSKK